MAVDSGSGRGRRRPNRVNLSDGVTQSALHSTNETELFAGPAHAFRGGGSSVSNFRSKL